LDEHNTPLSPTALVHKLIDELMFLSENMIYQSHQRVIEKFRDIILNNRTAISDTTNLLPLEAALFVIQVVEHENTFHDINELHQRIDRLARENKELRELLDELRNSLNAET
jgi:hypothetical protein